MKILHGFSAIPPSERKEKPMEYLTTDMVTTVPEGTSPAKVDELPAAEVYLLISLMLVANLH